MGFEWNKELYVSYDDMWMTHFERLVQLHILQKVKKLGISNVPLECSQSVTVCKYFFFVL